MKFILPNIIKKSVQRKFFINQIFRNFLQNFHDFFIFFSSWFDFHGFLLKIHLNRLILKLYIGFTKPKMKFKNQIEVDFKNLLTTPLQPKYSSLELSVWWPTKHSNTLPRRTIYPNPWISVSVDSLYIPWQGFQKIVTRQEYWLK